MATTRAFNILEQRNSNENQRIGKTPLAGKNETRAPFKLALKDLTNSSSSRPNFNGKQAEVAPIKKPLQPKSVTSSSLQKKSPDSATTQQAPKKQLPSFSIFTPQDAEYSWGREACLREDLLEQMIQFNGYVYRRETKPLKPLKVNQLELPEFEVPLKKPKLPSSVPKDLPNNFLFSVPEVEMPDLDFMF